MPNSRNFKEVNERIVSVEKRMFEIDDRLDRTEKRLDDMEQRAGETSEQLQKEIQSVREEARDFTCWANDAEQHARRKNLRFRGLSVKSGESCKDIVLNFCRQTLHAPITEEDIEVAHPLTIRDSGTGLPQSAEPIKPIIVRFYSYEVRSDIISRRKTLKGTKQSIVEDLTGLNSATLNRFRKHALIENCWSWNGRLFASTKGHRTLLVKPFQAVQDCLEIS